MPATPRNWLCLITNTRETENIDELTRDIHQDFDGICAVVHRQGGDESVFTLLNERKGGGFVAEVEWINHMGWSRNRWLLDQRISLMDMCWTADSLERFNPAFTSTLAAFSADLLSHNIWNLYQYSKLFAFRRWYNQQYMNGLHTGVTGLYGQSVAIDKLFADKTDRDYFYSVRNEKRPSDQRIRHEVLYLLDYGANGNHLALFHNDPAELDRRQWELFQFAAYLAGQGVVGVDQFRDYLLTTPELPSQVKRWINLERPFRNFYRYHVLGQSNEQITVDEDTWTIP